MARSLRGGVKAWPKLLLKPSKKTFPEKMWPLKSKGGGGGKALVAGPLKKNTFFTAFLIVAWKINKLFYHRNWIDSNFGEKKIIVLLLKKFNETCTAKVFRYSHAIGQKLKKAHLYDNGHEDVGEGCQNASLVQWIVQNIPRNRNRICGDRTTQNW